MPYKKVTLNSDSKSLGTKAGEAKANVRYRALNLSEMHLD